MQRVYVKDIYKEPGSFSHVLICGWVRTVRTSKNFGFIELNDGTYFKNIQIVIEEGALPDYDEISKQNVGASLRCEGDIVLTPQRSQPFEMHATAIKVEGTSTPEYPLQKKRHSVEFLREIAHLRPRANLFSAVFRIRSETAFAVHDFFHSRGFVYVHTPIITGSDCEGAGAMFRVTTLEPGKDADYKDDFFGKKTSLTVSGQLNIETYAMAFSNVYTFGPTFRAENSNTPRHAAEFWMKESEMAVCDSIGEMDMAEAIVKHIISHGMEACPEEIEFLNNFQDKGLKERLELVLSGPFARVTYTEAMEVLKKAKDEGTEFEYPVFWGCDLQSEHEKYLTEKVYKKPVFVTDYPKDIKAFYMRQNDDGKTVAAVDLLVPGIGELIGGSQREERLDVLSARMKELGLKEEDYSFYLDLRKFGGCVHSGYGLGFERMVMYLTGVTNIRDVIPFPRTPGNCAF